MFLVVDILLLARAFSGFRRFFRLVLKSTLRTSSLGLNTNKTGKSIFLCDLGGRFVSSKVISTESSNLFGSLHDFGFSSEVMRPMLGNWGERCVVLDHDRVKLLQLQQYILLSSCQVTALQEE